jgi:hypothetical protein
LLLLLRASPRVMASARDYSCRAYLIPLCFASFTF